MTLTLGAMATVFATAVAGPDGKPVLSHMAAVAGLAAANLDIVAFAVSWGPVMWVLLGEMFPNEIRGAALAISGATNWAANLTVTVTFLPLLKTSRANRHLRFLRDSRSDLAPLCMAYGG